VLHGIDVSSYQPPTPDVSGLAFLFIKITEGTSYINREWQSQYADGKAHGLVLGKYHYPNILAAPVTEANYFLAHADVQPGDVLILDWEWYGTSGVTSVVANAYKSAWLARVKAANPNNKVILYSDRNNWLNVDTTSYCQDGLWIADYTTAGAPRIQHPWVFHQYSSSPEDEDVANPSFTSLAALKTWAGVPTPAPPPPTPTPEDEMPSFNVADGGVTFPEGKASTIGFFCDNTLFGGANDPGATLRVVIWAWGKAPEIHENVVVNNKDGKQTVIHFTEPSLTHSVTVTRQDKSTYPVFGEVS
jgi:hypothetical protein